MSNVASEPQSTPSVPATINCSIGVMAYNEGANIGQMLQSLLEQKTSGCTIEEILVVASGCTDDTEDVARKYCAQDPRVKLLVQPRREGKASAVNLLLRSARCDIVISATADTFLPPTTVQRLVEPFADPDVGMTGGRPVPVNDPSTFMGFAVHLLWEMHHHVCLQSPKLGELTAFRRVFERIPRNSAVDEANMEPLIRGQGYRLRYVPDAVVYNHGPETVGDFLKQRRRIYAGHLRLRHTHGYVVSTMSPMRVLIALLKSWRFKPRYVLWTPAVIGFEVYGRLLGWIDFHFRKRDHAIWDVAVTTKGRIDA